MNHHLSDSYSKLLGAACHHSNSQQLADLLADPAFSGSSEQRASGSVITTCPGAWEHEEVEEEEESTRRRRRSSLVGGTAGLLAGSSAGVAQQPQTQMKSSLMTVPR